MLKTTSGRSKPPDFSEMKVGDRVFLKCWTLDSARYAIKTHNHAFGTSIKIRCESVEGCPETGVAPGVVARRVL